MHFNALEQNTVEFVVHFVIKDLNSEEKKHFAIPVYVFLNKNEVDLYPSVLDFGIIYPNSGISHKLTVRAIPEDYSGVRVGFPFVPVHSYFEYDFSSLTQNHGVALPDETYLVGKIVLKTNGLKEGDHRGHLIFCKDKVCSNDEGKSRIFFKFTVARDPLNARSKMHSFEIVEKNTKKKKKSFHIQFLWMKNTFSYPMKIDDFTSEDKELSLTYTVSKDIKELEESQYCCVSSLAPFSENCRGCKTLIHDTNSNLHKLVLNPEEENEDIKIRYEYHPNKSRTIEVKYIVAWTEGTYVPIPVFIYDKSLGCSFEYFQEDTENNSPFMLSTSQCKTLPEFRQLDFGPVAADYLHSRSLTIVNLNPLSIFIDRIRVTKPT